ncbi:hypothetical protein Tco_0436463 [Tanacetum coccineum]
MRHVAWACVKSVEKVCWKRSYLGKGGLGLVKAFPPYSVFKKEGCGPHRLSDQAFDTSQRIIVETFRLKNPTPKTPGNHLVARLYSRSLKQTNSSKIKTL